MVHDAAPPTASEPPSVTEPSGAPDGPTPPVVLVVDDDPVLGRVVEACLDFEGAEVRLAHTLDEARRALSDDLDHVVLDRLLPDGDGLELLPDLAQRCPGVPIVVLTAYDHLEGAEHLPRVDKADIATLCDHLGLEPRPQPGLSTDPAT